MKYAILGPRYGVIKVLNEPNERTVEISDELAEKATTIRPAFLIDNDITNHMIEQEKGFQLKWDEENKVWNKIPITRPVPQKISARQIRLWLVNHGISMDMVDVAIDGIEDETTKQLVKVEWEYAPHVERNHAWLIPMAQVLGFTEEQIDQCFRESIKI